MSALLHITIWSQALWRVGEMADSKESMTYDITTIEYASTLKKEAEVFFYDGI